MNKKTTVGRDSLAWAGSSPGEGKRSGRPTEGAIPSDRRRLHELKHKLDDDTYVDGAVTRIANFLTSTLKKKGQDEHERK